MPIYDSSFLTQRWGNKVIARDFINRLNRQNITSYGPLQGNYDNSILNNVAEGRQQNITKCQIGYQVDNGGGCPCTTNQIINPPLPNNNGKTRWINSLFKFSNSNNFDGQTEIIDIVTDSSNNIYAVGYYRTEVNNSVQVLNTFGFTQTLSSYTLPATPTDVTYGFIIKYTTDGIVQWATYIPAGPNSTSSANTTINSISIDSSDNIYVLGSYISNQITLQNVSGLTQTISSITLPANSLTTPNTFVVKYTSGGLAVWAKFFTANNALPKCIEVDSLNNIYITGGYLSSTLINLDGVVTLPSNTSNGAFLIKYNTGGTILWATYIKGTDDTIGFNISFDSNNNIFVTGSYKSSSTFNLYKANAQLSPSQLITSYTLQQSAASFIQSSFLIKYDTLGDIKWATYVANTQTFINPNPPPPTSFVNITNEGIANICDSDGNIYLLGKYQHTSFDPGNIYQVNGFGQIQSSYTIPAVLGGAGFDCYLIKYDVDGKVKWVVTLRSNFGGDDPGGIVIDSYNNIYITGQYESINNEQIILQNASGFNQMV